MTPLFTRAATAAFAFTVIAAGSAAYAGATAAAGGSSVGISASSAGSASSRGSSNSIEGSSDSSSGKDKTAMVQDGTYRVATVTPDTQGGTVRLGLEPQGMAADAQAFVLNVPMQALGDHVPATGDLLQAQRRDYGVQFARADQPFYLVLADAWNAELDSRPLTQ